MSLHMIDTHDPLHLIPVSTLPNGEYCMDDGVPLLHGHQGPNTYMSARDPHRIFRLATETDLRDHRALLLTKEIIDRLKVGDMHQEALYKIREIVYDPKNHIPLKHP